MLKDSLDFETSCSGKVGPLEAAGRASDVIVVGINDGLWMALPNSAPSPSSSLVSSSSIHVHE